MRCAKSISGVITKSYENNADISIQHAACLQVWEINALNLMQIEGMSYIRISHAVTLLTKMFIPFNFSTLHSTVPKL